MKILITGGSGLVGSELTKLLIDSGNEVVWLGRTAGVYRGIKCYKWDYKNNYIDKLAFVGVTHIVHLAGAGVFDARWTAEYKKEIIDSRTIATELLFKQASAQPQIEACICASAIGVYGNSFNTQPLKENAKLGNDFLANVTKKWELATTHHNASNLRIVNLRIGIVLAQNGGALSSMVKPIKYFIGSPLASGKQIISWIHIKDLCSIILTAIQDNTIIGVYNAVAPNPVTNSELTNVAAQIIKRPLIMPNVPTIALEMLLGKEKAASVIEGIAASSSKIESVNFKFKFPTIESALKDLL